MTETQIRKIGSERLAAWLNDLVADHATPVLLVGVGHDSNIGVTSICVPEDLSPVDILRFLKGAIQKLEERR